MKKSTRTFLFALFAVLFLITTPFVISYSQGYRIDWQSRAIVKTGALYLEPRPAPVELYIDGKLRKKSSFIFQNIFVGNLIPKKYSIEIRREGYSTWRKTLAVSSKLVTESRNITLFPSHDPKIANIIGDNLDHFLPSPSGKYFALVKNNSVPSVSIYGISEKTDVLTFHAPDEFAGYKIKNMQWSSDSTSLLFSIWGGPGNKWVLADLTSTEFKSKDISAELAELKAIKELVKKPYKPQIEEVKWSISDSRRIFFIARDSRENRILFSYNLAKKEASPPLAYDVLAYSIEKDEIVYVSAALRNVNRISLNTGELSQGSYNPIPGITQNSTVYFLPHAKEPFLLFAVNKSLYLLDKKATQLKKVFDGTEKAVISKDAKKLLIIGKNTLAVYWTQDIRTQPFRDSGDIEIIYTSQDPIRDAVWFSKNNEYVIFSDGASIKVIELDSRDKRNIFTIFKKSAETVFYGEIEESLYFLSEKTLYSLSL